MLTQGAFTQDTERSFAKVKEVQSKIVGIEEKSLTKEEGSHTSGRLTPVRGAMHKDWKSPDTHQKDIDQGFDDVNDKIA
jgi:hypothetical protein